MQYRVLLRIIVQNRALLCSVVQYLPGSARALLCSVVHYCVCAFLCSIVFVHCCATLCIIRLYCATGVPYCALLSSILHLCIAPFPSLCMHPPPLQVHHHTGFYTQHTQESTLSLVVDGLAGNEAALAQLRASVEYLVGVWTMWKILCIRMIPEVLLLTFVGFDQCTLIAGALILVTTSVPLTVSPHVPLQVSFVGFVHTLPVRWVCGLGGAVLARRASFFDHSPPVPVFAPISPNNLEYLLAVSKNLAHHLHPV